MKQANLAPAVRMLRVSILSRHPTTKGAMVLRPVSDSEAVVMRLERRVGEPIFPDGRDGRDVIRHAGDDFRKKGKWRNMK